MACEECYYAAIRGTSLESQLTSRGEVDNQSKNGLFCELYSPRMRTKWSEACANRDLTGFLAAVHERREVFKATILPARQLRAQQKLVMQNSLTQYKAGAMAVFGDNILNAAGGYGPYQYGNSSVGYGYATANGVQGAMMMQQPLNFGGNHIAQAGMLEARWKLFE